MARVIVSFLSCSVVGLVLATTACSTGEIAVGRSEQELKTRKDGKPTGDGTTCSWAETVAYDTAVNQGKTPSGADAQYSVGDQFPSLDRCNECECTTKGIMCTIRSCGPTDGNDGSEQGCTLEALVCPDGSAVGRVPPSCDFAPCPGAPVACPEDVKQCPDGSWVSRTTPSCEFAPCPGDSPGDGACPADAKQCPDGSWVVRSGPKCQFAPCP